MTTSPPAREPTRQDVDAMPGVLLLEFGSPTCRWCIAAQATIAAALAGHDPVRHIKVIDARGKRLGRSFAVTRWPTLIVLRDGRELARIVRPADEQELMAALSAACGPESGP